jgi:hypothetical protein
MSDCPNCATLQAEINRLRIENRRLAVRVKKLTQALAHVSNQCENVISRSEVILSEHQARGKWSYAKAARVTAFMVKRFVDLALAG